MKKLKVAYGFLMMLPMLMIVGMFPVIPDLIPAHYNAHGVVDRWGSKIELLIFPVFIFLFGLFMKKIARYSSKIEENGQNNEKVTILAGLLSLVLFNAMNFYFLILSLQQSSSLSDLSIDLHQVIFSILGITLILIGNVMPKAKMNSIVGLRTTWSMKNEDCWKKSQRFGGISSIIGGILLLFVSFMTKGIVCFGLSMVVIVLIVIVDVIATSLFAK